jgi:allophanate hydrolase
MQTVSTLLKDYRSGTRRPGDVIQEIFSRIRTEGLSPVWISLANEEQAVARSHHIDLSLPLAGIPFAVKDNIDVAGMSTTAGCPSYAYTPDRTATVVTRLLEAGAILIGKTNMDQFATGLVGTRTPYGACSSVFDERFISGGSSSGSAVAVAKQVCTFSLGTDTAGSGRVPAAFNGLVGMKPTRGVLSTKGVVPACRSLDCISIFAQTGMDALQVWNILQGFDPDDPYSRPFSRLASAAPWLNGLFQFGVPAESDLEFFGDTEAPRLYELAVHRLTKLGGVPTTIDFAPFRAAAELLYQGPWVAERLVAVGKHIAENTSTVDSTVSRIILGAAERRAEDAYRAAYRLEELQRAAETQWARMDVLLLPTTGTIYTIDAVNADPVQLNSNLGYYTNFVNLMDLAAIALPGGFRRDGLPFGVSLVGPAFSDLALLELGQRFLGESSGMAESPGCIRVAVVGAHLEGQPLNSQLTERGARLIKRCRTSADYKLFALAATTPPKPGLLRQPGYAGPGIEVEVWSIPEAEFGGFVANVPEPLAIGNVELDTGEWVKGFVCEPVALLRAQEITRYGGWRSYLSRNSSVSDEVSRDASAGVGRS